MTDAFFDNALFLPSHHKRWRGVGASIVGVICVVFAKLGREGVSIISMRPLVLVKGNSMPKHSKAKKAKGYTADDMRAVSDNPQWTKDDFAKAKSFDEVFPSLARKRRGKQKAPTKKAISLRLDRDVLDAYRADGEGWQSRINNDLRKARNLD